MPWADSSAAEQFMVAMGRPRQEERRREYPRDDDRRQPFGGQQEGFPSRGARRGRGRERNGDSPDRPHLWSCGYDPDLTAQVQGQRLGRSFTRL